MKINEKITKLTWNENTWTKPSGANGKSSSKWTHENTQGYGHEEWLLDKSKVVFGYHYGFIKPLNVKTRKHVNQVYKLWLYTVTRNQKYLVGYIDNLICISSEESIKTYNFYKKKGWLKEMNSDLESVGVNSNSFQDTTPDIFFNVKFKISDIFLFDDFMPISKTDKNITIPRYKLLDKKSEFKIDKERQRRTDKYTRRAISEVTVDPYHIKIQEKLLELLKESKKYKGIQKEKNYVDIQAIDEKNNKIFFEIKTDTAKNNIRQAIGQLLEYSMYFNETRADKLIIVGDKEPDEQIKKYIQHLRKITKLSLYYLWIDMEQSILSNEY